MVTERAIYYAPEGETAETSHNIYQLSEDFPQQYPTKVWGKDGIKISLNKFPYVEQDEKSVYYCSHDNNAPEGTFKSWIQENPVDDRIVKGLSFTTRLGQSTRDSINEVTIKERLSLEIRHDIAGIPTLVFKNPEKETVKVVHLTKTGNPQAHAYYFKTRDCQEDREWEEIRTFLGDSLRYFVKELSVLYDRERRLELNFVLD